MKKESNLAAFVNKNNPIPKGESAEFEDFAKLFMIWSIPVCIIISYYFVMIPEKYVLYAVDLIPFEERVEHLRRLDQKSYVAFVATVLSGGGIFTFVVASLGRKYWRSVVAVGKCKPVRTEVLLVVMLQAAFSFAIFFMTFVDVGAPADPRWPGMTRIFLWPIFPFWGALVSWFLGLLAFAFSVGILKFIYIRES